MSVRRDTITGVSQPGLHLILGDEELLVERTVADVLRAARESAGTPDIPVDRLRAGEVGTSELAELLSPSLFADERVVVLEAAGEAGKDAAALIATVAVDLPPGTELVVVHSGGGRAKALATQLRDAGARVYPCAKITKPEERAAFVRAEFTAVGQRVSEDVVTALLDAVGSDIRELAAATRRFPAIAAAIEALLAGGGSQFSKSSDFAVGIPGDEFSANRAQDLTP